MTTPESEALSNIMNAPNFTDFEKAAMIYRMKFPAQVQMNMNTDWQRVVDEAKGKPAWTWGGPVTPENLSDFMSFAGNPSDPDYNSLVWDRVKALFIRDHAENAYKTAKGGEDALVLVTEAEILARPAPEWWVEDLIQKGTVAVFAGEPGIGKTFLTIAIARSIATGAQFFNHTVKRGTVLYVAAEGASAFGKRARAWDDANYTTPPEGSIHYIESGIDLSNEDSVNRLEKVLDELQPDLIVLDTLSQLGGVTNENDAAQMSDVLKTGKRLRDRKHNSTVLFIHHLNKSDRGQVRGSGAIRGNSDTVIVARPGKGDDFYISTKLKDDGKQKDGTPVKLEGFKLVDRLDSAVVVQAVPEKDPDVERLKVLFADELPHTKAEARIHAGHARASNSDAAYQRWDRKWRKWTTGMLSSEDGKNFTLWLGPDPKCIT